MSAESPRESEALHPLTGMAKTPPHALRCFPPCAAGSNVREHSPTLEKGNQAQYGKCWCYHTPCPEQRTGKKKLQGNIQDNKAEEKVYPESGEGTHGLEEA